MIRTLACRPEYLFEGFPTEAVKNPRDKKKGYRVVPVSTNVD